MYKLLLPPGTDCSPCDQGQINWYQIGNKICYIPKVSKFYVEKRYRVYVRAHQQMTFIMLNRFCSLSETPPPPPVFNGHNETGWNTK